MNRSQNLTMTETDGYVKICSINELKEDQGKRFLVDDNEVAVFKINSRIYALSNVCPHQHFNLIYDGFIEDSCVICPVHGWKFNLETGKQPTGARGLDSYPVEIVDEDVYVKVIPKKLNW